MKKELLDIINNPHFESQLFPEYVDFIENKKSPNASLFAELYAAFKCTFCGCVCEYWDEASFKEKRGLSFRTCMDYGGKLKYTKEKQQPAA